jgi:CheY-like chemotaxis protein/prolyl-tRNA editing enzyme YbaK/EbsC (Cys-tRNA(Pro) deacylase)
MSIPRWLPQLLRRYEVPYRLHRHLPVHSATQLAHAEHVSGHRVAKPVFLAAGKRPITVVVPASTRVDLGRVKAVLGLDTLRFATEDELVNWFKGCTPGSIPPVRIRSDQIMLMDRSLAHFSDLLFAAGSSEDAVSVRFRDWYRMVRPGVGRFTETRTKEPSADRPMVLVVEDEHDTNEILCELLIRAGYACRGVEAGSEALRLARSERPAAIVLDLMLPDMTGFDVCQELRRVGPLKRPPVVVVTALSDDESRRRGQELGADAYLTKPFPPQTLMRELRGVLADARA